MEKKLITVNITVCILLVLVGVFIGLLYAAATTGKIELQDAIHFCQQSGGEPIWNSEAPNIIECDFIK